MVVKELFAERYVLQEQIGDGRMSSVYLALDNASGNSQVAVKILNTAHADEIKRELFKRETSALRKTETSEHCAFVEQQLVGA